MKSKKQELKNKIYWPFSGAKRGNISSASNASKFAVGKKKKKIGRDSVDFEDIVVSGGAVSSVDKVSKKRVDDAGKQKRPIVADGAVNFVLEEYSGALHVKFLKKSIFLLFVVIFSVFTMFSLQILLDFQKSEINRNRYIISSENDKLRESIKENLKYKDIAYNIDLKLASIDYILDNHIYWSNLFEFLEVNTLDTVYYTNLENNDSGEIVLYAVGESFEDLSRQFEIFESSNYVEKIKVDSGKVVINSNGDDGVGFNMVIRFVDRFFLKDQNLINME